MEPSVGYALHVAMGIGLAATCGLRTFLPLLALNLAVVFMGLELNPELQFIGSWPATAVFGTATVLEIGADKIPGVDHILDAVGIAAKPIAATLLAAAVITGTDPLLAGVLGLIAGGVSASAVGALKAQVRAATTITTAGMGNAVVSTTEDIIAFLAVATIVLVPAVAVVFILALLTLTLRLLLRRRRPSKAGA